MYLNILNIYANNELKREIKFKKGLNLITNHAGTEEGNALGKTTVLSLVYYCLGGDVEKVYATSKKLKSKINTLKNELIDNKYYAEIIIKIANQQIKIKRALFNNNHNYIDDKQYNAKSFKQAINNLILQKSDATHPTWNELKSKFIKTEIPNDAYLEFAKYQYNKPVHFYIISWLYLFGFEDVEVLGKYYSLSNELKNCKRTSEINKLQLQLLNLNEDINKLEEARRNFVVDKYISYKKEDITQKQEEINSVKNKISNLKTQIDYARESISSLKKGVTKVESSKIEDLFNQFKVHQIKDIVSEYDKVLSFHNSMINNKVMYLKSNLKKLENSLKIEENRYISISYYEQEIINYFNAMDILPAYDNISNDIRDKSIQRAQLIEKLEQEKYKNVLFSSLDKYEQTILNFNENFQEKLTIFNSFFRQYTNQLLSRSDLSVSTKSDDTMAIELSSYDGKTPSKAETKKYTILIDLAYLSFSIKEKLQIPKFLMIDSIEEIYEKDLNTLFKISSNIEEGQVIFTCLSDKFYNIDKNILEESIILKLSEDDKLFRF